MAYSTYPTTSGGGTDWESIGRSGVDLAFGGSNPRSGGADPCCPPGYNPSGVWPRNANVGGAPPDYRQRGSPMEDASPSGTGRLKDDFCDCIPIRYGGKFFMLGEVRPDGKVYTGPPQNRDNAVWVEVNPTTGRVVSVPGIGGVGTSGSGGPSTGGDIPVPTSAGLGPLLAIGAGALLFLFRR